MSDGQQSAGDVIPANCELIEVRVAELRQLFNAIDASPFRDRDLDPDADEFIVGRAREAPRAAHLALLVELGRAPGRTDEPAALRDTIHEFFLHRARVTRSRLYRLLSFGRISLLVGLVFLAAAVGLADVIVTAMKGQRLGELLREGLVICGWVAMWRPLEIFLYGWWPIRTEARLYDRLSTMPVRIAYKGAADSGAWRSDWPEVPPAQPTTQKAPPHAVPLPGAEEQPAGVASISERGPIASVALDAIAPERKSPGGRSGT